MRRSLSSSGQLQLNTDEGVGTDTTSPTAARDVLNGPTSLADHSVDPSRSAVARGSRTSSITGHSATRSGSVAHDSSAHGPPGVPQPRRNTRLRGARASIFAGLGMAAGPSAGVLSLAGGDTHTSSGGRHSSVSHTPHGAGGTSGVQHTTRHRTQTLSDLPKPRSALGEHPPRQLTDPPSHTQPSQPHQFQPTVADLHDDHSSDASDSTTTMQSDEMGDAVGPLGGAGWGGAVRLTQGTGADDTSPTRRQSEPPPSQSDVGQAPHITAARAVRPSANAAAPLGGGMPFGAPHLDLLHSAIEEGSESGENSTVASSVPGAPAFTPQGGRGSFVLEAPTDTVDGKSTVQGSVSPPSVASRPPPPPSRASRSSGKPRPPPGQSSTSSAGRPVSRASKTSVPPPAPPRKTGSIASSRKAPPPAPPRGISSAGSSTPTMQTAPESAAAHDTKPVVAPLNTPTPPVSKVAPVAGAARLPPMRMAGGSTPPPPPPPPQTTTATGA